MSGSALQRVLDGAPLKPGDPVQAIKELHRRLRALEQGPAVPAAVAHAAAVAGARALGLAPVVEPESDAPPTAPVEPSAPAKKAPAKRAPRKAAP